MPNNPYRTGPNSVDIWTNTSPNGSGTPIQPITDASGNLKVNIAAGTVSVDTTGLATEAKQDTQITSIDALLTDAELRASPVEVSYMPGTIDTFGHLIIGQLNNQIDVQFFADTPQNLTTVTVSGSGAATQITGGAQFATGVGAAGTAKAVTAQTISYRSGAEVYALFTATFTTPTDGNGYQRVGIYTANEGFWLGYDGQTFKAGVRTGGSDAGMVAKASWNGDTLTGAVGSKFTRGGTPEAIDFTKFNLFRIRFGWLGSAPIKFEVASPDGRWVTFHTIRQPNNSTAPSVATPNLPLTMEVGKTGADATNLIMKTNCWGAGITNSEGKLNATITANTYADLTRSVITGETTAGGGAFVNVKVNPSGAVAADVTQNTSPWVVSGTTNPTRPTTGTSTQVADSASNAVLLVANANRLGATIFNDSSATLYVHLGAADATTSAYSVKVVQNAYMEVPYGYTGEINGIWASDPNDGAARITEFT